MLSCPHPLTPCLGRECERARTSIYTHTYTHTRSISVHVHNRSEMVLQRNSFYACTSPVGTLENSFQRRLSEMPAYTRLQLIAESFRPIDFHETDARLYYRHAQLERLLVTRCSARFFSLFSFFQRKIFVRFSCNPLPRSTRYQISFLTRYYSEQLRFFVYLSFTKFYAVEKQVTLR